MSLDKGGNWEDDFFKFARLLVSVVALDWMTVSRDTELLLSEIWVWMW